MSEIKTLEHYLISLSMHGPSAAEQRDAEKAFKALSSAIELFSPAASAAGGAVLAFTNNIAGGLAKLHYEAQRLGTTTERLKAAEYAGVQAGSNIGAIGADLKTIFDAFSLTPDIKETLKRQLGLKDDDLTDTVEALRKIDEALNKRFHGTKEERSAAEAIRIQLGLSLENVLAAGRPQWKAAFDEQIARGKGLNETSKDAIALERSLNRLHAAIGNVFDKAAAELFAEYGLSLDEVSTWIDEHQDELVDQAKLTIEEFHKAWNDISYVGGPIVRVMKRGFDELATTLDKLLGHPDGKHGGIYGLHYALDALALYIMGSTVWRTMIAIQALGSIAKGVLALTPLGRLATTLMGAAEAAPEIPPDIGKAGDDWWKNPKDRRDLGNNKSEILSPYGDTVIVDTDKLPKPAGTAPSPSPSPPSSPRLAPTQAAPSAPPAPAAPISPKAPLAPFHDYHPDLKPWGSGGEGNVTAIPEKHGALENLHAMVASIRQNPQVISMMMDKPKASPSQWSKTNNIGTRKQVTNIQLASTDPHAAASEIARHMKTIQSGALRSLDKIA